MKKNYLIIGLLIALAMCIFFLLQPDQQHDTHTDQHAQVVANKDSIDKHGVDYRHVIDSLSIDNYRLDSANKSLKQGQATTRKQLDLKTAEARELAKEIQRRNKDTPLQIKIDSLVDMVENYSFLLGQYERYTDSINRVNDSLKVNHETTVQKDNKRIAELQIAYDALFKSYQQLFADSRGLMKDLKKEKLKTKVIAVLAGAAAVLGLVK